MSSLRQTFQINIFCQGHSPSMDLQDFVTSSAVRYRNSYLAIKPARTAERLV